jgi:hypothetical protein
MFESSEPCDTCGKTGKDGLFLFSGLAPAIKQSTKLLWVNNDTMPPDQGDVEATSQAADEREIPAALDRSEHSAGTLRKAIEELAGRLEPVVRAHAPPMVANEPARERSPMAERIQGHTHSLVEMRVWIDTIIENLAV